MMPLSDRDIDLQDEFTESPDEILDNDYGPDNSGEEEDDE